MSFDKELALTEIRRILSTTPIGAGLGSVESAGWVERVIARDGQVTMVLNVPPDARASLDPLKAKLQSQINQIPGVVSVNLLEKAQQPGPAAAPSGAPGAGFGAQGIPGVRHIIAVASGKGGVGKSTIAVNIAAELARTQAVGLLDSDVYGPSIPKMLGLEGERPRVERQDRIVPLERYGITTMSIGFLLEENSPVIWRGPMVTGLLRQFISQVAWGELDYLIVDMPPGTGDAQLTLVQNVALSSGIIVTTPQDVALLDVQRGIEMFRRVEVPVLGIVENMSGFRCPHCNEVSEIFPAGGVKAAADKYGVPILGSIPLERSYASAGDRGKPAVLSDSRSSLALVIQDVVREIRRALP
ncbi:MAG: Mrp/NBP35 family ATP-binding protein [Planctomycetota bacterium]